MWQCNLLTEVFTVYLKIHGQQAKACMQINVYWLGIAILILYIFLACNGDNSCNNACFLLEVKLASIAVVLCCMPKNVREVVGPSRG